MVQFDDGKEEGALRTIGEVSEALGIKQHVLRYWEQQFPLLDPLKRSGGRRYYRSADIAMVEAIDRLVNAEGYTLKGAEAVLRARAGSRHDRRENNRRDDMRVLERRPGTSSDATADVADVADVAADGIDGSPVLGDRVAAGDIVARLGALRQRLADSIED